jgi:hypothetical protein
MRAAVVAALSARPGLTGPDVVVRLGQPPEAIAMSVLRRVIVTAESTAEQQTPTFEGGNQAVQDTYVITVLLEAIAYGSAKDGRGAEALMSTLAGEVAQQLVDDPEWGGACVASGITLASEATRPLGSGDGWGAAAVLDLHFRTWGVS